MTPAISGPPGAPEPPDGPGPPGGGGPHGAAKPAAGGAGGRRLVPAYLATGGRERPAGTADFDRLTVLLSTDQPPPELDFGSEHRRLWQLLRPGALTVVECAAHLGLPVSATVFLAADLVGGGHLLARSPVPKAEEIDRTLIERLLVGLRALP